MTQLSSPNMGFKEGGGQENFRTRVPTLEQYLTTLQPKHAFNPHESSRPWDPSAAGAFAIDKRQFAQVDCRFLESTATAKGVSI